jgi:C4-dicarboxylate-specific signal transduction histidine kinase
VLERAKGLGLRGQIALILGAAFALGCAALLALSLRQEAGMVRRVGEARAAAVAAMAEASLIQGGTVADLRAPLAALVGPHGIRGLDLALDGRSLLKEGEPTGTPLLGRGPRGRVGLSLWTTNPSGPELRTSPRVLVVAFATTGVLVVLLALLALTRLIVLPVASLTAAAEQLEAGQLEARVPIAGAREVAQLGLSFNRMAKELSRERLRLAEKVTDLERMTTALRATQEQVVRSEKLASVGRLSAGLAHEIGNPLAAILGLVELLKAGGLSAAEAHDFLERVQRETERIHRILRELLDFARQRPSVSTETESADLARVVRETERLLRPQSDARQVRIDVRAAPELPRVAGSEHELSQVVLNLLLNATDAIAGAGKITVELSATETHVMLTVTDSGPGIASDVLPRLFEPFVTTKPEGKGTGLGLAVCQGVVARLGGSIEGKNAPGGGAVFRVQLPHAAPRMPL